MNTEELKRMAEAATPGPWYLRTNRHRNTDGTSWGWLDTQQAGDQNPPAGVNVTWSSGRRSENNADFIAAANPAAVLELIQQRDELLAAMHRIRSTPPAQADGGGFVVDHFDIEGEYAGSQNIDPMWVVQEMAAVASAAIAKAEG